MSTALTIAMADLDIPEFHESWGQVNHYRTNSTYKASELYGGKIGRERRRPSSSVSFHRRSIWAPRFEKIDDNDNNTCLGSPWAVVVLVLRAAAADGLCATWSFLVPWLLVAAGYHRQMNPSMAASKSKMSAERRKVDS
ncbi:predicted protein [Histoplasma capsulatum var. duboisii H88]|uniref:Predicted protein n=1 Tax=Ajellomyces capsulatus (strain H88) TaxID=544711 RepID=F0UUL4_AJEC8|nr:predicted protein [Histoplasma capsulatum var. duboisii H88]